MVKVKGTGFMVLYHVSAESASEKPELKLYRDQLCSIFRNFVQWFLRRRLSVL